MKAQNDNNQKVTEKASVNEVNGSNKRKNDIENENPSTGSKKQKKEIDAGVIGEVNDTVNSVEDAHQSGKVKWCTIGKTILRAEDDKELSLKKFQKKIIAEYLSRVGNAVNSEESVEVLWSKCQKKLSKNPKFKIHKERIKLVS